MLKEHINVLERSQTALQKQLARYREKFGDLTDELTSKVTLWHAGTLVPSSSSTTLDDTKDSELLSTSDLSENICMPAKHLVVSKGTPFNCYVADRADQARR